MVSMGIMVHSFRGSLEAWLEQVLPADLYFRAGPTGDSAYIPAATQERLRALPGMRRIDFIREQQILLDPARPRVTVIARELDPERPQQTLPLIATGTVARDASRVWVNEPAAAIYGYKVGQAITMPLGGHDVTFEVAGIWRDYARQQGALVIERARLVALTGDRTATNGAVWLAPGTDAFALRDAIVRDIPGGDRLDIGVPAEIRAASLRAFDRTFAVTYALELAAVAIGLVGLSSSFGALVLTRRREFGMLRHIGMTRRQIGAMLASEGFFVSGVGMLAGVTLGWLMSLVLIHVVNRQSFHWGMELALPWLALAIGIALVLLLAMGTAVLSGRSAMSGDAVRAVREDW
jgi:putative ABC transport system permease protein